MMTESSLFEFFIWR